MGGPRETALAVTGCFCALASASVIPPSDFRVGEATEGMKRAYEGDFRPAATSAATLPLVRRLCARIGATTTSPIAKNVAERGAICLFTAMMPRRADRNSGGGLHLAPFCRWAVRPRRHQYAVETAAARRMGPSKVARNPSAKAEVCRLGVDQKMRS